MRTTIFVLGLLVSFVAASMSAQERRFEIVGSAVFIDPSGKDETDEFSLDFGSASGYGLGLNFWFSPRVSVAAAASVVKPDANFSFFNTSDGIDSSQGLELIPITGLVRLHFFRESRFNPYLGAGVGYVLFDDVSDIGDLSDADVGAINFKDDYGFVGNAGLDVRFGRRFSLNVDAKYLPLKSDTEVTFVRGEFVQKQELSIDPLIVSAGIGFSF
ncbi:MAG TPA: OmpW family outer membrane protein [Thermoanaerobaculia bacterium]|nr:OmpW family outer membrane protein [Thermoanaerobaculia bacterium]